MIERWVVETLTEGEEAWEEHSTETDEEEARRTLAHLQRFAPENKARLLRMIGEEVPVPTPAPGPTDRQLIEGLQEQHNKLKRDFEGLRAQIKRLFGEGKPFLLRCPVCAGTGSVLSPATVGQPHFVGCSVCSGKGELPLLLPPSVGGYA